MARWSALGRPARALFADWRNRPCGKLADCRDPSRAVLRIRVASRNSSALMGGSSGSPSSAAWSGLGSPGESTSTAGSKSSASSEAWAESSMRRDPLSSPRQTGHRACPAGCVSRLRLRHLSCAWWPQGMMAATPAFSWPRHIGRAAGPSILLLPLAGEGGGLAPETARASAVIRTSALSCVSVLVSCIKQARWWMVSRSVAPLRAEG